MILFARKDIPKTEKYSLLHKEMQIMHRWLKRSSLQDKKRAEKLKATIQEEQL